MQTQTRLNGLGGLDDASLDKAITETYAPVQSYNTRAIRRLSVLSNVIPPSLKGCGIVIGSSGGHAHVTRLTHARLDVLAALQRIGTERRARLVACGARDTDANDELDICMEGFRAHIWSAIGQLIPVPLSEECIVDLYHTGGAEGGCGICGLTGVCPVACCSAVAAATQRLQKVDACDNSDKIVVMHGGTDAL